MAIRYLLDTNTISYIVKRRSQAAGRHLKALSPYEEVCASAITEAELLFGLERRPEARVLRRRLSLVLQEVEILPWRHEEAVTFSRLRTALQGQGKSLAPYDLLIAAHALTVNAVLVTSDKAFSHVPGLPTENWATDL